ncbi:tRNA lysidine(34) synthetase TilS [Phenylobacterium sp. LjRoot219]|uniref:tRNA lysidine(34) synthetase TilS n=1 Tax=Phenylobacterium sp. LjRoot219 TaxID=3342283 RepID=UPI003ED14F41
MRSGDHHRPFIRRAGARHLLSQGERDGLSAAACAVLDRRLDPTSPRPIAVALSGGGDSVALLLMAQAWAQAHGRPLVALTVDHQLRPESRAWTDACAALAARVGAGFQPLAWEGPKPAHGLPAAARAARHQLLADAARAMGASVILIGHTADDVLEGRAMRAEGATTPAPREWSPSPAWPEGRGLFLLRPLLGLRRAELRAWLAARGETWIEDPANADPRFARARARAALPLDGDVELDAPPPLALAELCRHAPGGAVALPRAALRAAPFEVAQRLLAIASVCAGGAARLPAAGPRGRLTEALRGQAPVAATHGRRADRGRRRRGADRPRGRRGAARRAAAAGAGGRAAGGVGRPLRTGAAATRRSRCGRCAASPGGCRPTSSAFWRGCRPRCARACRRCSTRPAR